jgi:hypothetical protein
VTKAFLMCMFMLLLACSRPQRIAEEAGAIRDLAESSRQRFVTHQDTAGEAEQVEIIDRSSAIAVHAAGVQDVEPPILQTVELVAVAVAVVAAVVLAWQLGLGILLRRLFGWIPERERCAAKLLRESVAGETNLREAVAVMRAQDPLFDAAYRRP